MQLEHVARRIVIGDRAAGFQRHAGMPPDREFELDHGMGGGKRGLDTAVLLAHHRRFGAVTGREFSRRQVRFKHCRQGFNFYNDGIGRVFGAIGIVGKYYGHRLADVAHALPRQHRLAIGLKSGHARGAKLDRRQRGDVHRRPHRKATQGSRRRAGVDANDAAMRMVRAHYAHIDLVRKGNAGGIPAATEHQRQILEPRDRLSNIAGADDRGLRGA